MYSYYVCCFQQNKHFGDVYHGKESFIKNRKFKSFHKTPNKKLKINKNIVLVYLPYDSL